MAFRADYLARETGQNLVRNPLPTIAAITTVGVALTMLAVSHLASLGIDHAFSEWNNDVTFIIYLKPEATQDQYQLIRRSLEESPQVDTFEYLDPDKAFANFKELFRDQPEVYQGLTKEDVPTSFRVKPKNPDATVVEDVVKSYSSRPGVFKVDFVKEAVRAVQRIGGRLQGFLVAGTVVLSAASVLLIFNTIQTAIFARRREIEVMRLVGASNWYIRIPFVMEGLVQGLAGSLFAGAAALLFSSVWKSSFDVQKVPTLFDNITWTNSQFWWTVVVVGAIGTAVSGLVALISTTWYLRD